ncbi:MAG: LCP family glycopolymer transferase [Bacillota bacterium]
MGLLRSELNRKNRIIIGLVAVVFLITAAYAGYKLIGNNNKQKPVAVSKQLDETGRVNILLLGTDSRPDEKTTRSDTIILLTLDRTTQKISMLSVPRDSLVEIPGHGTDRINAALGLGGPELAAQVVSSLLDQEIDYYVLTRMDGFKDIIDTLGGVTIDVEKNMHYIGRDSKGQIDVSINLKKGPQHLNGEKALQYVRFRQDALGDITRTQRQQKLLKAMAEEFLQPSTIIKIPALIPALLKTVQTNLTLRDAMSLVSLSKNLDKDQIVTLTLPGSFLNLRGASYWKVSAQAKDVVNQLVQGNAPMQVIEIADNSDGEIARVSWKSKPIEEPIPIGDSSEGVNETWPTDPQPGATPDQTDTENPQPGSDPTGTGTGQADNGTGNVDSGTDNTQPGAGGAGGAGDTQPGSGDAGTGQPGTGTDTGQPNQGTGEGTVPPVIPPPEQSPPLT